PPVRYSRLLIRYLGCNRLGLDFSSAWLASAFDLVLGRYWHSGADLPSYNVVESQSPECSRPVRAPGNGTAFIVASGVRCGLDAPPGPGLAPVRTLTQFPKADLREGPQRIESRSGISCLKSDAVRLPFVQWQDAPQRR